MKVLHVITGYAGAGGAEKMLSRLVESSPQCEHSIVSLTELSDLYKNSLDLCVFRGQLNWNLVNTPAVVWRLRKIIDLIKPDVIQGWMYHGNVFASVASRLSRAKPPVFWGIHHSLASIENESVSTKVALYTSRLLSRMPVAIVYCARSALAQHKQFGFDSHRNIAIPNGVIVPDTAPDRLFNTEQVTVGFAGRYHTAKGFPYLFEAISYIQKRSPNVLFKLVGSNVSLTNPEIVTLVDQYQIDLATVEFGGQVSDMSLFYKSIDLFMLTSITEGFPNVLVEAMAAGVPCVSTDVGDAGLIIDGIGSVVPARDSVAISNAILGYIGLTAGQKADLSEKAYLSIKARYQLNVIAEMYQNTWGYLPDRYLNS